MGELLGFRDLDPRGRCGGWYSSLEAAEEAAEILSFDTYVSEKCNPGAGSVWFLTPASAAPK